MLFRSLMFFLRADGPGVYTGSALEIRLFDLVTCVRTAGNRFDKSKFQVTSVYQQAANMSWEKSAFGYRSWDFCVPVADVVESSAFARAVAFVLQRRFIC